MIANLQRDVLQPRRAVLSTHSESIRRGIRELFVGQSIVESSTRRNMAKQSRSRTAPKVTPPTRGTMAHVRRTRTAPATLPTSSTVLAGLGTSSVHVPNGSRPVTPNSLRPAERSMSLPEQAARDSYRPIIGVDLGEQSASLANSGRRRQARRARKHHKKRTCAVDLTDRRIRAKFIACCLSAMSLLTVLTIYLALALSNREESQEFHVLLILVILATTIFFCHSLIRLCMVLIHIPSDEEQPRLSLIGPGGYANPSRPIRVALARDEEAVGIDSEAVKNPPPAYGLWRESVRADPNRLFWQRTETRSAYDAANSAEITNMEALGAPRPPSYASDDGVGYVLEVEPRFTTPRVNIALPSHPREQARVLVQSN